MATSRTRPRLVARGRRVDRRGWLLLPAFVLVGALGGFALASLPESSLDGLMAVNGAGGRPAIAAAREFPICAGGTRVTCVVDGDTFWLDGVKFRVADIDTPEVSSPGCASEAALGWQATLRMRELLSQGPFELAPADRDEDRYGRKLRIVERDGESVGAVLVAEGLAHVWGGPDRDWC